MSKKTLWKDIKKCFLKSKGRFISITCLIALGSFALVGLQVAGPNMRMTGENYFNRLNLADISIIGDYGIDEENQKAINQISGAEKIEYGYLKDVVIRDTITSIRIFSNSDELSVYEVVEGRLPETENEIAIASIYHGDYSVGDKIAFTEKEDTAGETALKHHEFQIVGFVNSGELLSSINMGQSTAGTGELQGYAVVDCSAFDYDVYMIARISFTDTAGVDPYSDQYTTLIQNHKNELNELLTDQPDLRLSAIRGQYQEKIDEGQAEVDDAKQELADVEEKLSDGERDLADAKQKYADGQAEYNEQKADADRQLGDASKQLADGEKELADAKQEYADGLAQYNEQKADADRQLADASAELEDGERDLADAKQKYADGQAEYNEQKADADRQLADAKKTLDDAAKEISAGGKALADAKSDYRSGRAELSAARKTLDDGWAAYNTNAAALTAGKAALAAGKETLDQKQAEYDVGAVAAEAATGMTMEEIEAALPATKAQLDASQEQYAVLTQLSELKNKRDSCLLESEEFATLNLQYQDALAGAGLNESTADHLFEGLDQMQEEISAAQALYDQLADLVEAGEALAQGWIEYDTNASQLAEGEAQLAAAKQTLEKGEAEYAAGSAQLSSASAQISAAENELSGANSAYQKGLKEYDEKKAEAEKKLADARDELDDAVRQISDGEKELADGWQEYYDKNAEAEKKLADARDELGDAAKQISDGETELADKRQEYNEKKAEADAKLADARAELNDGAAEIDDGEAEYQDALTEYEEKKPDADEKIMDAEVELADARETLEKLKRPIYTLDTRREIPGSEGYRTYSTVSSIIDALADIFPIFLYLVAALVTLTTMTRFVDEERVNSGTLKALGYSDKDIIKKFTVYGGAASLMGAVIGIVAGHTLLPLIVYKAYGHSFTLPKIELSFYPGITAIALLLAIVSAVIPAYLVATKELKEKPAALLQPKPPEAGSKIFLERIRPLWNRMSFTHKVTARNLFRYKKRMLMTIFGVCGAVTLLFAGFSVQHSISGINNRQFGDIIQYDLIVAKNDNLKAEQTKEIEGLLKADEIKQQLPIYYEEMTKVAGNNQDKQSIKLLVTEDADAFRDYISLVGRTSGKELELSGDGVILSERLAKLLDAKKGTMITVTDSENHEREMMVSDITEMYTGHFIFMNTEYYRTVFEESYHANANLITLNDRSIANANEQASRFVSLNGVKGVVQNTTLINQIDTIVSSLNMIMQILIIVAIMLAVVILYNLTNINVSERIRELSTIKVLGFYNKEVTLYIYRETMILTLLGILAGFGLGDVLYLYIISVVPPDDVMFNPALGANAFLVPVLVICIITAVLGVMINRRLKNVNMLEALKSVE